MYIKAIFLAAIFSLLAACSGGSSDGDPTTVNSDAETKPELTGAFIDSRVAGLRYETPTRSGVTNSQGEFKYLRGESVSFSIGATVLGTAPGSAIVTPFDLFTAEPLTRGSEIFAVMSGIEVSDFERAINVASLLQALDEDANPDNGIDVSNAKSMLADKVINLNVKTIEFEYQERFVSTLQNLGLTAFDLNSVVSHLYDTLDLVVEFELVDEVTTDQAARHNKSTKSEYDAQGNLVRTVVDMDSDGQAEQLLSYSYDASGNTTAVTDSITGKAERLTYDRHNNVTEHITEHPAKAAVLQSFEYTDDNEIENVNIDIGNDGELESVSTFTYDENGQLVSVMTDLGNDAVVDASASYDYSDGAIASYSERVASKRTDSVSSPVLTIEYEYDNKGNPISQQISSASQNTNNSSGFFDYDDAGNVVRYEQDNNRDGVADYIEASNYDTQNNRTYYRRDTNADGKWDTITQYFYDDAGNRIAMKEDSNGDGIIDKRWSSNYQSSESANPWQALFSQLKMQQ